MKRLLAYAAMSLLLLFGSSAVLMGAEGKEFFRLISDETSDVFVVPGRGILLDSRRWGSDAITLEEERRQIAEVFEKGRGFYRRLDPLGLDRHGRLWAYLAPRFFRSRDVAVFLCFDGKAWKEYPIHGLDEPHRSIAYEKKRGEEPRRLFTAADGTLFIILDMGVLRLDQDKGVWRHTFACKKDRLKEFVNRGIPRDVHLAVQVEDSEDGTVWFHLVTEPVTPFTRSGPVGLIWKDGKLDRCETMYGFAVDKIARTVPMNKGTWVFLTSGTGHFMPSVRESIQQIQDLIRKLDDADWKVREDATTRLKAGGSHLLPELKKARSEQDSPEVRVRLRQVIGSFDKSANSVRRRSGGVLGFQTFTYAFTGGDGSTFARLGIPGKDKRKAIGRLVKLWADGTVELAKTGDMPVDHPFRTFTDSRGRTWINPGFSSYSRTVWLYEDGAFRKLEMDPWCRGFRIRGEDREGRIVIGSFGRPNVTFSIDSDVPDDRPRIAYDAWPVNANEPAVVNADGEFEARMAHPFPSKRHVYGKDGWVPKPAGPSAEPWWLEDLRDRPDKVRAFLQKNYGRLHDEAGRKKPGPQWDLMQSVFNTTSIQTAGNGLLISGRHRLWFADGRTVHDLCALVQKAGITEISGAYPYGRGMYVLFCGTTSRRLTSAIASLPGKPGEAPRVRLMEHPVNTWRHRMDHRGRLWCPAFSRDQEPRSRTIVCLEGDRVVKYLPGELYLRGVGPDDTLIFMEGGVGKLWVSQGKNRRSLALGGMLRDPNCYAQFAFDSKGRLWINNGCGLLRIDGAMDPEAKLKVGAHYTRDAPPTGRIFFDKYGFCWVVGGSPHAYRFRLPD